MLTYKMVIMLIISRIKTNISFDQIQSFVLKRVLLLSISPPSMKDKGQTDLERPLRFVKASFTRLMQTVSALIL